MPLTPGARLGPYEIAAPLGEGGMGQVWRARDTKLDRDVALKILPEAFVHDADRVARFTREAKTLAALNHPHIAGIYGLEESGGVTALVMELVEGEGLDEKIASGTGSRESGVGRGLPLDETLAIARQIAEALEAAHEQGIVHRDLKPANVKVRPDGTVKVLDFGLAKALQDPKTSGPQDLGNSPTITSPAMTGAGIILGTAAYMAPEQARGAPVDRRADLWAFGVVLYEMLTGTRLFDGATVSDTLAAVLTKEPVWTALPATTPAPIRKLLRRCLEKDRKRRLDSAADARLEIEEALSPDASPALDEAGVQTRVDAAVASAREQFGRTMRARMALVAAVSLLVVGATAGGMWVATRPAPPRVVQTAIPTGTATPLGLSPGDRSIAITPDGARIVYRGGDSLVVRALDTVDPVSLDTSGGRNPFVSSDGQWVGFVEANSILKKVAITGGPALPVAQEDGFSRGAVWLPDDTIVFATAAPGTGLQQVAAGGGAVTVLTRPDREQGEEDHVWPEALPGGRAVLFTITSSTGDAGAAEVAVLDLATGTHAVVLRGGSHAQYVARRSTGTGPAGYLVYAGGGALRAVAFDPETRTTSGTPVPVVPEVVTTVNPPAGGVQAAVAADGTLAYLRTGVGGDVRRTLAWVDRQGRETAFAAPPRVYLQPRVSPDGSRLAVAVFNEDLWVGDVAHDTLTRLTFMPGREYFPVWRPDSRRLFFSSDEDGVRNLYAQAADGTGTPERLTTSPNEQYASGVTPDGTRLLFTERSPQTGFDIMQMELAGSRTVTPLVQTPAEEDNGVVSPDGRWLAYQASESGAVEIYVRPYPDVASGRWQVSAGGGMNPLWARDGRELFYVSPAGDLMRVGVESGTSWGATPPTAALKDGAVPGANLGRPRSALSRDGTQYDVSPDGERFLVLKDVPPSDAAPPQLIVIQHFDALLQRLVPGQD